MFRIAMRPAVVSLAVLLLAGGIASERPSGAGTSGGGTSWHRGKLFYRLVQRAVAVDPAPYASLVKHVRSGKRRRRRHKM